MVSTVSTNDQFNRDLGEKYSVAVLKNCDNYHPVALQSLMQNFFRKQYIICPKCKTLNLLDQVLPDPFHHFYYDIVKNSSYVSPNTELKLFFSNLKPQSKVKDQKNLIIFEDSTKKMLNFFRFQTIVESKYIGEFFQIWRAVCQEQRIRQFQQEIKDVLPIEINLICFFSHRKIYNPLFNKDCKHDQHNGKLIAYCFQNVFDSLKKDIPVPCSYPGCRNKFLNLQDLQAKGVSLPHLREILCTQKICFPVMIDVRDYAKSQEQQIRLDYFGKSKNWNLQLDINEPKNQKDYDQYLKLLNKNQNLVRAYDALHINDKKKIQQGKKRSNQMQMFYDNVKEQYQKKNEISKRFKAIELKTYKKLGFDQKFTSKIFCMITCKDCQNKGIIQQFFQATVNYSDKCPQCKKPVQKFQTLYSIDDRFTNFAHFQNNLKPGSYFYDCVTNYFYYFEFSRHKLYQIAELIKRQNPIAQPHQYKTINLNQLVNKWPQTYVFIHQTCNTVLYFSQDDWPNSPIKVGKSKNNKLNELEYLDQYKCPKCKEPFYPPCFRFLSYFTVDKKSNSSKIMSFNRQQVTNLQKQTKTLKEKLRMSDLQIERQKKNAIEMRETLSEVIKEMTKFVVNISEKQLKEVKQECIQAIANQIFISGSQTMQKLQMQNLSSLLKTLQRKKGKSVKGLKLLYRHDPICLINFHHYIDNKHDLLIVARLDNQKVVGGFTHQPINKTVTPGVGFIFSLSTKKSIILQINDRNQNARVVIPQVYQIIFGNAELKIVQNSTQIFSNVGVQAQYFNSRAQGVLVTGFLGTNNEDERQAKMITYEFFQVQFE